MTDRKEVERLLLDATTNGVLNITHPMIAELCRTWLAVQDAPTAEVMGECVDSAYYHVDPDQWEDEEKMIAMKRQRVRIVPYAAGGEQPEPPR